MKPNELNWVGAGVAYTWPEGSTILMRHKGYYWLPDDLSSLNSLFIDKGEFALIALPDGGLGMRDDILQRFEAHVFRLFVGPPSDSKVDRKVHAAVGVAGEAGEILDTVKKHWVYGRTLDIDNIEEEIGDAMFYLQALAFECGLLLEDAMEKNMEKLAKRYPNGYTNEDAILRRDKNGDA